MKKVNIIIFFLILSFFKINVTHALTFHNEIIKKYDQIFSTKILSSDDIINYKKIFENQEICKWKTANKHILLINNDILMGHVLAQRYLHPKCYKSKYIELYYWLKKYNDLPQAKRIYRLAVKRMPKGYKSPVQPTKVKGIEEENILVKKQSKYKSKKKLSKNQKNEKRQLLNNIKSRVNNGWPTGALKLLNQRDVNILLDQVEIDQQKELIAKGYFLANEDDNPKINELAIKLAREALEKSSTHVPYAGWTAGLCAWRLGRYEEAAEFFSNFSISLKDDVWHQASGSFWAARSYAKLNKYEDINFWLKRAAINPNSFYGMLSTQILGIEEPINWKNEYLSYNEEKKILVLPAIKRIKALIQIGLLDEIEKEIMKVNSVMNQNVAIWSLNLAQNFNLAYTQLKIASKLQKYGVKIPIQFFYPTPLWKPKKGFSLEPALIFAFMHQESMFNASAKSRRGAMGLMQVMPSTAKFISSNKEVKRNNANILKIPEINIEVGQEYIEYLLDLDGIDNNLIYLTAAYNGGPGNLQKWKENTNYLDDPLFFMESIPSRETRWFIEKVLTKYWIYSSKLGNETNSLKMLSNGENPIY
ncbi:MAG: Soluble lytic murein transglycosylase [Alphaproteobacteria bacterium MarineAlpha5_Bin8]|nr:MAG: Soluble lytic murein transglycosylase [Alphaproteobacteria bacterium MarineAlpha5_Bin7]PPR48139.1 MAG: Soluble lytic murein transglycosylase [Alphaproteobacteria bacterium MarineAlpha5_Bin8]PPR53424.1 MAG: Soluble lytic murein transglycosylase [Alphaproteobacteria bacterium MarineAlpha5_Bin6]|tara:strand:- start:15125 stop:16891 length:1767 start_codon:yes stop_codon:yes gene_type:complete